MNYAQVVSVREPEGPKPIITNNNAASNFHLDKQSQRKTSSSVDIKVHVSGNESRTGSIKTSDTVVKKTPVKPDSHLEMKGVYVPAPLATKIYYSQRNHRLRSALSHMYHTSSVAKNGHDLVNIQQPDRSKTPPCALAPKYHEPSEDHDDISLSKNVSDKVENLDESLADSSDVLDESTNCPPMHFSDQVPMNNVLVPQRTYGGNLASNALPNPFLFAGN